MYIYFERHKESGKTIENSKWTIKNCNILVNCPESLNSNGLWGFRHVTERRHPRKESTFLTVDQYWMDPHLFLKKNTEDSPGYGNTVKITKEVLKKLNINI